MTEETRAEAEKLSRAEGTGKSAIEELDKWSVREKARDDLYRRDVESKIAFNEEAMAMNRRSAERAETEHAVYLKDVERGMAIRELGVVFNEQHLALRKQSVVAFERIAAALEKLTAGK